MVIPIPTIILSVLDSTHPTPYSDDYKATIPVLIPLNLVKTVVFHSMPKHIGH